MIVEAGPGTHTDKKVVLDRVSKGMEATVKNWWKELNDWNYGLTRLTSLGV